MDDALFKLSAVLERLSTAVRSLQRNVAREERLYPIQCQVLLLCSARQKAGLKLTTLAAELGVSAASMSDTLKALEAKGLIHRIPEVNDSRGNRVELTKEGKRVVRRLQHWQEPIQIALAQLDFQQRGQLYEFLLSLLHSLYKQGIISMPHMCLTCRWLHHTSSGSRESYYCQLLEMVLEPLHLQIECPDHEPN